MLVRLVYTNSWPILSVIRSSSSFTTLWKKKVSGIDLWVNDIGAMWMVVSMKAGCGRWWMYEWKNPDVYHPHRDSFTMVEEWADSLGLDSEFVRRYMMFQVAEILGAWRSLVGCNDRCVHDKS